MNFIDRYFRSSNTLYEKGLDYLFGRRGREVNLEEAFSLLSFSAEMENPAAARMLQEIFEPGKPELLPEFAEVYDFMCKLKLAEEAGDPEACFIANYKNLNDTTDAYTYESSLAKVRYAASQNFPPALYHYAAELNNSNRIEQDHAEALRLLRLSAQLGYFKAIDTLYKIGEKGLAKEYAEKYATDEHPEVIDILGDFMIEEGNSERAMELYERAAKLGNIDSMYSLGYHAEVGDVGEQDLYAAATWYQQGAEENHPGAMVRLARIMKLGPEEFRDPEGAFILFRKAAEAGYFNIWNEVGDCYKSGFGVEKSGQKARECYLKAAASENPGDGYLNLYYLYRDGEAIEADMPQAVKWLEKAAEAGSPIACWHYGMHYKFGIVVDSDLDAAYRWFKIAADEDFSPAVFEIGRMYLYGAVVEQDVREAFKHFKLASDDYAPAMDKLGHCYSEGIGCERNGFKAFNCYMIAAHEGNVEAMYDVGLCYRLGEGVEQDIDKAIEWYEKAIEMGHAGAMSNCAILYDNGIGVEQDFERAYELYRKAAELGNYQAQFCLGSMYFEGRFVEQDFKEAVRWFTEAAKSGEPDSLYHLALCYNDGLGVEQDSFKAVQYLYESADKGWKPAIDLIREHNIPRLDS